MVGPSGETVRTGTGFGGAERVRTTRTGSGENGEGEGAGVSRATTGAGTTTRVSGVAAGASVAVAGEVVRAGFLATASSGATSRRMPSASALRRTRSAWASSIDEEALFTPMPNDWETSSSSLLVRPSSRASSWTRIFFVAKTILHLCAARPSARTQFLVSHTSQTLFTLNTRREEYYNDTKLIERHCSSKRPPQMIHPQPRHARGPHAEPRAATVAWTEVPPTNRVPA